MRQTFAPLFFVLLLSACGGGSGTGDAGGPDLLVGTWFEQVTPVTSDNQTATFTFRADLSYTYVHTQLDPSTSSTPGCTETQTDVGTYTESGSGSTMRMGLTPIAAMSGGVVRSGCTSASDDGPGPAATPVTFAPTLYTVTATTLTFLSDSGMVASTLTRR